MRSPHSWFQDCAHFGATITATPNFALEITARVAGLLPDEGAPWRRLVVGGERVDAGTIDRLCRALGEDRLPRHAIAPAYGLAEAVLAVAMAPVGRGPTVIGVDREALADGRVMPAQEDEATASGSTTRLVSAGLPIPGSGIETLGEAADVGEIRVSGPTLADGYLGQPAITRQRFTPQGLLTGDLGFVHDGQLYVTGRNDDLLVVGGRNVYARDIETAILATGYARPGSCSVVQLDDDPHQRLIAVLEPIDHHPSLEGIAERMKTAVRAAVGVGIHECVFLPPGMFPKTPSGKPQRFRCI
jgi:acyl-CoA synthetase (AMP-forming)/AMP-acid ligase II